MDDTERDDVLTDFNHALGALVTAGLAGQWASASQATQAELAQGTGKITVLVELPDGRIVAHLIPAAHPDERVELFRVELAGESTARH